MLLFCFPVRCMMYGFGDEQVPFTESVDLLEDLVVEYITEMVRRLCLPRASHNYVMYQRTSQVRLWVIGTFTWDYQLFVKAKHPVNVQWLLTYPGIQSLSHCSSYYIWATFQTTCNHQLSFLQLMPYFAALLQAMQTLTFFNLAYIYANLNPGSIMGKWSLILPNAKLLPSHIRKIHPRELFFLWCRVGTGW